MPGLMTMWFTAARGVDTIYGRDGGDILRGGTVVDDTSDFASDSIFGGNGDDILDGHDESADFLRGEAGNDHFRVNNDDAAGGPGNDYLQIYYGEGGHLTGGTGSDYFVIETTKGEVNNTVITDFS